MPSFQDSAVIFFLALLLFGPKKLPELARQLGKLMGEFRRASNEFRMQMEDELRTSEQEERQKQIAAIAAAAPAPAPVAENSIAQPAAALAPLDAHPHEHLSAPAPVPIASSGSLDLMPPATGLPVARTAATADLAPAFDAIPHADGAQSDDLIAPRPDRYTHHPPTHDAQQTLAPAETTPHA